MNQAEGKRVDQATPSPTSSWLDAFRLPVTTPKKSTLLHPQSDATSLDLIQWEVQQLKAQTACINAEAKVLKAQAMRLHPAVQRCEHSLTARPWFPWAAALLAILIGAGAAWFVRLAA